MQLVPKGQVAHATDRNGFGLVFIGGKTMTGMPRIHTVAGLVVLIITAPRCFSAQTSQPRLPANKPQKVEESIHMAAQVGDQGRIKALLDQGIGINVEDDKGNTPLAYAIRDGHDELAEFLIDQGADINHTDKDGYIPLSWAIWNEDRDMIKLLVTNGADVNFVGLEDWPFLHYVAQMNDRELVELLLARGAKLNVKDDSGRTELHIAISEGHRDMVEFLVSKGATAPELHLAACLGDLVRVKSHLEKGTDVDIKDELGWTPLYWAASMGQKDVAELLIAEGADVGINAKDGSTTLHQAARAGAVALVRLLVDKGIDVNVKETYGNTPLHAAASKGHSLVSEVLINYGANVNARTQNDSTPLHRAALGGHPDVVKVLMGRGADVNAKDKRGLTALDWAMRGDHTELVELLLVNESAASAALVSAAQSGDQKSVAYLLNRGADVNYQDDFGLSPLHVAASKQDKEMVRLFLTHKALVNVKDKAGRTALHYAVGARQLWSNPKDGDIEAARLLLDHGSQINIPDKEGKTPLYYSVRLGEKMTELLLEKGADANYIDPRGIRALPSKQGRTFYMAPDGDDSSFGTQEHPFRTFNRAVITVRPSDTIYVRGGTYRYSHGLLVEKSGQPGNPIHLKAYPGETPVFDFFGAPWAGILVTGAFWRIKGIVITNAGSEAIKLTSEKAHHNILEEVVARSTGLTGIAIHIGAAHNLVLNCDAYRNFDFLGNGENADGFEVKFAAGIGNILIGNRAWNNADDGYDFWHAGNDVKLESCYAWRNGENIWSHPFYTGNGNGFKLGQMEGAHSLIRCVAWDHPWRGFDLNGNSTGVTLHHCTAFRNRIDFAFMFSKGNIEKNVLRSNLSCKGSIQIPQKVDDRLNSWNAGIEISDGDFLSLDDNKMSAPRNPDGSIPRNDFLRLAPGSAAIDKGADVGMPFVGARPDLGAFEYDPNETSAGYVKMLHQAVRDHDVKQIEQLLAQGEGINDKDWLGYTPLHWAVYFGYPDLIELLISKGADPDIQSNTGRYALEIARAMAYSEVEALLRKLGAKAGDTSAN